MHYVGIRELKNKLTHYLKLTRKGDNIVVTDRGKPLAIIHTVDMVEETAGVEERIVSLAGRGLVRLPMANSAISHDTPLKVKGKPVSQIITEDRR